MEAAGSQSAVFAASVGLAIVYMIVTTLMTIKFRARTASDFMVAARSVPAAVIGVVMMSEFIAPKSTIGVAQEAFDSGMAAGWAVATVAIGFLLFGWGFAKKLYQSGEYTISAAIAKNYGSSTQRTVSLIMIYALLLVLVAQYVSGSAVLSSSFGLSPTVASLLIAAVSTVFGIIGGQKSVAYVSFMHTIFKLLGVGITLAVALSLSGGIAPVMEKLPPSYFTWDGSIGVTKIIAWTIASVGAVFSTQYIVQAVSSLKREEDVRTASTLSALLCFPVAIALGLIGVTAKYLYPSMKSLYAFPVFTGHMPPLLAGLVIVSIIASILVAVGSTVLAISSLLVRDFYVPLKNPGPEGELRMSRLLAIPIGFLPLLLVFFAPQVLQLSFFTRALRLSISVVAIFAFYLPRFCSNRGATIGLIASTATTTGWYLMGDPFGIDNIYVALVTPALIIALDRLIRGMKGE